MRLIIPANCKRKPDPPTHDCARSPRVAARAADSFDFRLPPRKQDPHSIDVMLLRRRCWPLLWLGWEPDIITPLRSRCWHRLWLGQCAAASLVRRSGGSCRLALFASSCAPLPQQLLPPTLADGGVGGVGRQVDGQALQAILVHVERPHQEDELPPLCNSASSSVGLGHD